MPKVHTTLALLLIWLAASAPVPGLAQTPVAHFASDTWPALMQENGEGLFADLIHQALPNYAVSIVTTPWARATQLLVTGQVHGQIGTYRASLINKVDPQTPRFTNRVPIYTERVVALCHTPKQTENLRQHLVGKRYAWPRGYDYDVHFKVNKDMELNHTEQGIRMLLAKRLDCYIDDKSDIARALAGNRAQRLHSYELGTQALYVSFIPSAESQAIADALDAGLTSLRESGRAQALFKKWGVEENYPAIASPH
ncbi:transporter substrate-binding domain-containing protein [Simiduia sp. 21SJ11W-1]|uniref:substrate-binding periplasmic protein n=1 Tax=Simiduia sp. 21SJ11W-1 TaxID=2909669 RepID=UPI00209DD76E|nr:transporter substrate-binding domain-containing protein [Simiduia sp. 21SJ11W-1]UTA48396.1 transporter substrate-binding domain-containing protein [Simiduia sp. 21SJ11W-1]